MVIQTVWLTGQRMEKKFYSLRVVKAAKQDLTNSIRCLQMVESLKNFHWHMQNMVLILLMEKKLLLSIVRKLAATGNDIAVDGKLISIFSILPTMNQKRSALKLMQVMNSRCGMAIHFIFYLIVDQS